MPLSWTDIRSNAIAFSREWKGESSEDAEAKSFWDAFFKVFGISRHRVGSFEKPVKKSDGKGGYIDFLWKGVVLVEHKSRGLDLDRAYRQATDYFYGLKERDLPRYIIVSDFARIRLYDLDSGGDPAEFPLEDLYKNIRLFGFIAGYQTQKIKPQDPVNIEAAEKLGKLHDLLKDAGFSGHPLELFLVRVLFCLFAEDNAIFERQQFREWIEKRTSEDGSDLGPLLAQLFQVLNQPENARQRNLDDHLAAFRYINGKLFEEPLPLAALDRKMREVILDCSSLDWARISPAIFGALFQSIMDKKKRRNLGAHYTSETNILKALQPLFLDSLRAEFERVRRDSKRLGDFHEKLRSIRILDPACGCGNFLVVAYRELRLLELDVLRELFKNRQEGQLDVSTIVFVDVDQFYGIEVEEFPAQIAQVALWMTDHQMNQAVSTEFGQYFARLPLKKSPTIIYDNALRVDWKALIAPDQLSYIVGNPPFIGSKVMSEAQRADLEKVFSGTRNSGVLDYVACWYRKAVEMMVANPHISAAFVSTSSITQGEQVGALWTDLLHRGTKISFAHRTFAWSSEASGKAAVHCVIIGFALHDYQIKRIFDYESPTSTPTVNIANHINPYLVDGPDITLENRQHPMANIPEMGIGNKPIDGGYYLFTPEEKSAFIKLEPTSRRWFRRWLGADEFLNGIERWFLWLGDCPASELRQMPYVKARVDAVRKFRQQSKSLPTQKLSKTPTRFHVENIPSTKFLLIPRHSSETRSVIPMGFISPAILSGDANLIVRDADLFMFGVMQSTMHMAWTKAVCGRLESRYRYSAGIVYNNFPWPAPTPKQRASIETAAQAVLDARDQHAGSTLADLYDPLTMPPNLVKAHHTLDRAVDAAYGKTTFASEAERVAFLFTLYERLTTLFPSTPAKKTRSRSRAA
jgi:hypothetical protein